MISIQEPEDLLSIALHNIFSSRVDEKDFYDLIHDWNKKIVIDVKSFYPITVIFEGNTIKFKVGEDKEADIKLRLELQTLLDIAYGREDPLSAVGKGIMELEGLGDDSAKLVRFYNIFLVSMQKVANNPNINYYELDKKTR
jgi:putative sterol carrier protein